MLRFPGLTPLTDSSAAGTGAGSHSISWDVDLYTSNLTFSPVYFFWLNPNTPEGFTSHYFNISADAPSSDTVVTSTSANGDKVSPVATTASLISASTSALSTTNEQQQSDPTETTTPLILKVASTSAIENELPSATTTAGLLGASTSALSITNEQQQNYPTETTTPLIPEIASMSADGNEIFPATTTAESIGASNSALPTTANEQQRNHPAETTIPLSLKIGMGIGIGLGVPLLVAAGAFIGIRLQRRRKEAMPGAASYETMPPYDSPRYHEPFPIYQLDGQSKRISVYQLSDRGDTPRMFSRAELG